MKKRKDKDLVTEIYAEALMLAEDGKFGEALKKFEKALEINDDLADIWYDKGALLDEMGRSEEALEAYEEAANIDPDDPDLWCDIADLLVETGEFEDALDAYDKALELVPDDFLTMLDKAALLYNMEEFKHAVELLEEMIVISPDSVTALNLLGNSYAATSRNEQAKNCFKSAIKKEPENIESYENLAELNILQEKYQSAYSVLKDAKKFAPEDEERAILLYLECIALKMIDKECEKEEKELHEIIKSDTKIAIYTDNLEKWIAKLEIPTEKKKYLGKLTDLFKNR